MEAPVTLAKPVRDLVSTLELHANSLIITVFGDSILPRGGNIWLGSLIALARPFGISERLVRTGVYRLAREGWLDAQPKGRRAYYTITPTGLETFAEADRRIYAANSPDWDGRWRLVQMLPQISQNRRQSLRRELKWLGFGQISPTILAHPTADDVVVEKVLTGLGVKDDVIVFRAEAAPFVAESTIRTVAEDAWTLKALNADYERFARSFRPLQENPDSLSQLSELDAFVLRTLLIHDYRRILLKDPQLPHDLLPDGWAGSTARDLCAGLYGAIAEHADAHVTGLMETYSGTIREPSPAYHQRFGGGLKT